MTGLATLATDGLFDLLFTVDRRLQAAASATGTRRVLEEALDFVTSVLFNRAAQDDDLADQVFLKLVTFFVSCSGPSANFKRSVLVQNEIWTKCLAIMAISSGDEAFRRLHMLWTRAVIETDAATCRQILSFCERLAVIFVKVPGVFGLLRDSLSWKTVNPITVVVFGAEAIQASFSIAKLLYRDCIEKLDNGQVVDTKLMKLANALLLDPLFELAAMPVIDKETRSRAIRTLVILESFRPGNRTKLQALIEQENEQFHVGRDDEDVDYPFILSIK
jgi:hypothetical protein